MKHGLLASALLLASAGFASADYVIIVANVGGGKELRTADGGGKGGMRGGGMAGMRGGPGMMGMAGGPGPGMMGMAGGPGPGMMGMAGGRGPGMMGMAGGPGPGMMGMAGGPPPGGQMGMAGGMQMGMAGGMQMGMMGMRGGMMGMRGGMMGMMGGGMMGGPTGPTDADDVPYFVIAVVEVRSKVNLVKQWKKAPEQSIQVALDPSLGKVCHLLQKPSFGELFVITEGEDKPIPTVHGRYEEEHTKTMKEGPTAAGLVRLAEWTLKHGLVDKFPQVMDKLVEIDKSNPSAVAYLKVKADLDRKAADDPSIATWRGRLLTGYKVNTDSPHYLVVHNSADTSPELKTHIQHLENAFRGFYYWFALKKKALPVPAHRQVVILTKSENDFDRLRKILSSGPQVVDGYFARRENLAVMTAQRQDDTYEALRKYWKNYEAKDFIRSDLLSEGRNHPGVPAKYKQDAHRVAEAQMLALMLKALEQEAELATVSHDASRQLLFSAGLLPRNVVVPEWILFGMGSFFETPLQAPWPTIGAASPYYLPRWRDLKDKGLEKKPGDTLRKVVTDSYFRSLPPQGKSESELRRVHDAALRKARTLSWALTYYLAQEKLDGLNLYFTELGKMPRDLELDETALLGCFARAFGCVDRDNKVIPAKLDALEKNWFSYMKNVNFESEETMKKIRTQISDHLKKAQEQGQQQNNGGQGQGNPAGGLPFGQGVPPGGGAQPPGGQPQPPGGQPKPPGGGQRPKQ